jgi:hypothetical protein
MLEVWDLCFPDAGATGISFARSRVDDQAAGNRLLVHAAPPTLEVTVRDQDGTLLAHGQGLERGQPGPMSYLVRQHDTILLEDGWPTLEDLGRLVILPGRGGRHPQGLVARQRPQRMALAGRVLQPHLNQ